MTQQNAPLKYTPGPWEIVYRDDDQCMCMTVIAPKGSMGETGNVCRLSDDPKQGEVIAISFHQLIPQASMEAFDRDESDGNDRLIAAAPEMYEALKVAMEALKPILVSDKWTMGLIPLMIRIDKILNKVEGEEKR